MKNSAGYGIQSFILCITSVNSSVAKIGLDEGFAALIYSIHNYTLLPFLCFDSTIIIKNTTLSIVFKRLVCSIELLVHLANLIYC